MEHHIYPRQLGLITILFLFVIACTCGPSALLVTPTATPFTETSQATVPSASTQPPASNTTNIEGLQPDAPWLIVSTTDGLWSANMDGTNLVPLIQKSYLDIDLRRAVSSPAHQIAVLTSGSDYFHDLALNVISLPSGQLHKLTDLTTPATKPSANASPGDPILDAMRAIAEQPSYAWSPDGKKLAFIAALDKPKADVYVYDMGSGKIQKVSQDDGQDFWPTWSADGKSILYFEAEAFGSGAGIAMKGIWLAAADGSGSELLETSKSGGEQMLGWRDEETAVLTSWDAASGTTHLRLYNIRTRKQTTLSQGQVFGAAVATGISDDAGAVLYGQEDGLYLLPPGNAQPQKLTDERVSQVGFPPSIRWQEEGRIFIVHFEGGNLSTFMADGSQRQDAPFNPSTGSLDASSFGLIWGWTSKGGESEGAWISGPGLETVQILKEPATAPAWNIDNDLLFFVGHDLYRATFNSHYTDTAPVAPLTGDVLEAAWLGFDEALNKKYSPLCRGPAGA